MLYLFLLGEHTGPLILCPEAEPQIEGYPWFGGSHGTSVLRTINRQPRIDNAVETQANADHSWSFHVAMALHRKWQSLVSTTGVTQHQKRSIFAEDTSATQCVSGCEMVYRTVFSWLS